MTSKLHVPALCSNLVPRAQLLARLNAGLQQAHKLTLISAPAGFGKTNLLSEWVASDEVRKSVAWLSLDQGDNSPTRFWAYVIAAMQSALEGVGDTSMALLRSVDPPPIEAVLTPLLNELAEQSELVVLVLDDYHLLSREEIHNGVTFLIERLPTQLHMMISTRADPPLPLVRLRARGQLTELRGDDLRFTMEEARIFLNREMNLELSEEDLRSLERRIEGWIAGLLLAAISLRGKAEKHDAISLLAGSPYYALEYLAEEVLNQLSSDTCQFLTLTSILTQLCASLCDWVTGRCDSAVMLRRLYRENLFVSALDYEHSWYRYHQLFADLLRERLQADLSEQEIEELHQRACLWYEDHGYLQIAVMHALAAGNMERVANLAESAAQASLLDSWMTNLLEWLETLPENVLQSKLQLRIYQACALFFDGQSAMCTDILEETKRAIKDLPDNPENNVLREELWQLIGIVYAFVDSLEFSLEGKLDQSTQTILHAKTLAEDAGNVFLLAHAYQGLALNQYQQGQLRAAANTSKQLVELAGGNLREASLGSPLPIATAGYLLLANIRLDQNQLEEMAEHLGAALELCRLSGGAKDMVETYVMQSRYHQARGDLGSAYRSLSKAENAYHLKASRVTRFRLESQRARLNLEAGKLEDAMQWLEEIGCSFAVGKSHTSLPTIFCEAARLILARLYLAKHKPDMALEVMDKVQSPVEINGRKRHLIELYILKALALFILNQNQFAMEYFERALEMSEPEGLVRVFLDNIFLEKGIPMQQLLYRATECGITPAFTEKLQDVLTNKQKARTDLGEPLSKRELVVLELLANGLSNSQITERLNISLNTVKTHTGNIYSKLGVNNRTKAGIKGKALGIID